MDQNKGQENNVAIEELMGSDKNVNIFTLKTLKLIFAGAFIYLSVFEIGTTLNMSVSFIAVSSFILMITFVLYSSGILKQFKTAAEKIDAQTLNNQEVLTSKQKRAKTIAQIGVFVSSIALVFEQAVDKDIFHINLSGLWSAFVLVVIAFGLYCIFLLKRSS